MLCEAPGSRNNLCLRALAEDLRCMENAALDPVSLQGAVMEAPAQDLAYVSVFVPEAVALLFEYDAWQYRNFCVQYMLCC